LDDVGEADVVQLIDDASVEGLSVEFKRDMYGNSDGDRKEFLKDLSSFANSAGGHLVIGVEEDQGVAINVTPVDGNPDTVLQRLEQIARTGVEPRIVGTQMRAVPIAGSGFVYLIRVPRSWNPPHRVSLQNSNRFYLRSSAGAHEASVEELRAIFANGADMNERIHNHVNERVRKIAEDEGVVPLARGNDAESRLAIHILPYAAFNGGSQIDVSAAQVLSHLLQPIASNGDTRINFEGFMVVRTAVVPHGYTQVFRNGIIEATKVRVAVTRGDRKIIPTRPFIEPIFTRLPSYIRALQGLDVPPPFAVSIALIDVAGAVLGIDQWPEDQHPIDRPTLILPTQVIADYGSDASYRSAITPAIDALWNAVGFPSAADFLANFNEAGAWAGQD